MLALVLEYIREQDDAMYIQSPFEAEWQLVWLQLHGYIDVILSQDGDVFPLGATKWISDLSISSGDCNMADRTEALKRAEPGSGRRNQYLNALPVFCGCDYIDKLYRTDPSKLMDGCINADDKQRYLRQLERRYQWPPSVQNRYKWSNV